MRPTEILSSEHRVIEQVLDCLAALARAARAGAPDQARAAQALEFLRLFADSCHHGKEEKHLFARLAERGLPPTGGPVAVMLGEHEEGRRLIRSMEAAAQAGDGAGFAASADAYVALLRAHIQKEDEILFRLADQVLTPDDQEALKRDFEREEATHEAGLHARLLQSAHDLALSLGVSECVEASATACCGHAAHA
jgi:hemerythrin-like domain-containing protein